MSSKVIDEVLDEMDEEQFLKIIGDNSLLALGLTAIIFFFAYCIITYILPLFVTGSGTIGIASYISMGATIFTMMYVYRYKIFVEDKLERAWNITRWFMLAIMYSTALYIGGEVIVISLLGLGILITLAMLASEVSITSILTWRELKEWVHWRDHHAKKEEQNKEELLHGEKE